MMLPYALKKYAAYYTGGVKNGYVCAA